jgi:hypothetical protein
MLSLTAIWKIVIVIHCWCRFASSSRKEHIPLRSWREHPLWEFWMKVEIVCPTPLHPTFIGKEPRRNQKSYFRFRCQLAPVSILPSYRFSSLPSIVVFLLSVCADRGFAYISTGRWMKLRYFVMVSMGRTTYKAQTEIRSTGHTHTEGPAGRAIPLRLGHWAGPTPAGFHVSDLAKKRIGTSALHL